MFARSSTRRNPASNHFTGGIKNPMTIASNDSVSRQTTVLGLNSALTKRKIRARSSHGPQKRRKSILLGTLIIVVAFGFVFVGNLGKANLADYENRIIRAEENIMHHEGGRGVTIHANKKLRGGDEERNIWVSQESQPFDKDGLASQAEHLVMVAGHSVTVSGHLLDAGSDENDWFLLSYQKGQGLPQAIHGHIVAGIEEAHKDPKALLIFSGGETRAVSGPQTEAQAYYHVADAMQLWPSRESSVRARTTTEEFATDSFENLMFSIARFREVTGAYPKKITVVSFTFKQRRFETLHAPALRWPSDHFEYVGVDPPASTGFDLARSTEGELKNAATPFETDPYGCHSKVLQEKRKGRNPFKRTPPYELSCPEMKSVLAFCGPELIPMDKVPWTNNF